MYSFTTPIRFDAKLFFMPSSTFSRITDFCAIFVFGICAWLQLNDPDPILWMTLYAVMAALAFLLCIPSLTPHVQRGLRPLYWGVFAACVLWSFVHWPWSEEEWREVGGLGLIALWLWWRSVPPANQTTASEP